MSGTTPPLLLHKYVQEQLHSSLSVKIYSTVNFVNECFVQLILRLKPTYFVFFAEYYINTATS
jgi:hypothetical protein